MFKKLIVVLIGLISLVSHGFLQATELQIYNTQSQKFISAEYLFKNIPIQGSIVLGEEHYQEVIQKAEGDIIRGVLKAQNIKSQFSTCWEFLSYPEQKNIDFYFLNFKQHLLSLSELFSKLFVGTKPQIHYPYRHLFKTTSDFDGEIIAINAPRKWKKLITKGGLANLDKKFIPKNMELGGKLYKKRFDQAIGGHVSQDKVFRYFQAQSYTDSVMAESIKLAPQYKLKFIIAGSFHTDFNDGLVAQLKKYNSESVTTIKIVNVNNWSQAEIKALLNPHPEYGLIADYIYMLSGNY